MKIKFNNLPKAERFKVMKQLADAKDISYNRGKDYEMFQELADRAKHDRDQANLAIEKIHGKIEF
jgi:hypothetical protein